MLGIPDFQLVLEHSQRSTGLLGLLVHHCIGRHHTLSDRRNINIRVERIRVIVVQISLLVFYLTAGNELLKLSYLRSIGVELLLVTAIDRQHLVHRPLKPPITRKNLMLVRHEHVAGRVVRKTDVDLVRPEPFNAEDAVKNATVEYAEDVVLVPSDPVECWEFQIAVLGF